MAALSAINGDYLHLTVTIHYPHLTHLKVALFAFNSDYPLLPVTLSAFKSDSIRIESLSLTPGAILQ